MVVRSNRQILTRGKNYATKQSKKFGAEEVTFNDDSRLDYLTGFHKRKVERRKKAQEFNKEQDRLARIEERKRVRDERKQQMEEQLQKFKESLDIEQDVLDAQNDNSDAEGTKSDDSWSGFPDEKETTEDGVKPILKTKEVYSDETTVEFESLEPNENFEYLAKLNNVKLEKAQAVLSESITRANKYAKFLGMEDEKENKKKKKGKKFRYLTKNERKENQKKAFKNKHRNSKYK
ncbi:hypothetical protein KAFR_0E03380 [Kazachstania africana CBS 2517]|uniref:Ribosomal RNA-processing protein 17 n=1 Tax=Kazachstania africana (strain ATCC 22294 / BCRC 22015 / CBS 2517 / CECT 1963 / NBRC 1671 / NRRL Y-8276) TaxID=1071382 RepID=H2AVU0_KAZAF|nr:hypothetical protein KAFR_0E03380 [Kazachstania africana CBS 2517]CCF58490.1 hypothetical protein KAFR_0E03380 [Kazachstania africana CBS 2517]